MGRNKFMDPTAQLSVVSHKAKSKLQLNSDRRAIVNRIIDDGGTATLEELNAHFGFDVSVQVYGLVSSGWLEVMT